MQLTKARFTAVVLILLSSTACKRKLAYDWHTLVAPDGTFSVSLPGDVAAVDTPTTSATGGSFVSHSFHVRASKDAAYGCSWWEDPSRPKDQTADRTLDIARDGGLLGSNAKLLNENKFSFHGYPARDISGIARGNAAYDNRIVVVGNRLYTLLVVDSSGNRDDKSIAKFFNSLEVH